MPRTRTAPAPTAVIEPAPLPRTVSGPGRAHRRGLLVRFGVWAAIAAGPLALCASCAAASVPHTASPTTAQPTVRASAVLDPAGFAQMFV